MRVDCWSRRIFLGVLSRKSSGVLCCTCAPLFTRMLLRNCVSLKLNGASEVRKRLAAQDLESKTKSHSLHSKSGRQYCCRPASMKERNSDERLVHQPIIMPPCHADLRSRKHWIKSFACRRMYIHLLSDSDTIAGFVLPKRGIDCLRMFTMTPLMSTTIISLGRAEKSGLFWRGRRDHACDGSYHRCFWNC